jgi:acyl-CoA reductase-like NAD-dependent aldehyde dehydrogenase
MLDLAAPSHWIAPAHRPSAGRAHVARDPATLKEIGRWAETTMAEMEAALDAAAAAQAEWSRLDAKTRAGHLHDLAQRIATADHRPGAILLTREQGKPYPEAIGEIANCAPVLRYFAEMARDDAGHVAGPTQPGSFQYVRHFPLGVTVHVLPFNFPVLLMCWTVAASLAAGNACVVKPAPATTLSTLDFMKHFDGLPPGLLSCLPGGADLARALIESPRTHGVAFTGSVAAAREVAALAGRHLKPAVIEAGGSDPLIVAASAPLDIAAAGAVTAAFHLSGQVCTSAERIIVLDEVHDAFLARFVAATKALRIGPGLGRSEIGPLVSQAARDRVLRLVADAVSKGAKLACGGGIPLGCGPGWFLEPTILTGCTPDMALMRQECFGPVAAVLRVPDFAAALAAANASPFGLGASVFTTSLEEAMEAAERLEAGQVWVNNPLIDNDALPFGGWKASGLGRALGRQGLDAFRRSKTVVIDHRPRRQGWWYPYPEDWFLDAGGRHV